MVDFICFDIYRQRSHCLLSFATEDYTAICDTAGIIIPLTAKIFGFCLSPNFDFGFDFGLFRRSLTNLLNGLDTNNISIIVVDYSFLLEHSDVSLSDITPILNSAMEAAGFEIVAPFDSTYEQRIVYIGNTTDGIAVKDWLKTNKDKYTTSE